jgi:hypothetical protein
MTSTPFSLCIFAADGDFDGLRIVERSNWVARPLVFLRLASHQSEKDLAVPLCRADHSCGFAVRICRFFYGGHSSYFPWGSYSF